MKVLHAIGQVVPGGSEKMTLRVADEFRLSLAFIVVLGVRSIDLASGDIGRYFVVNSGSGETKRISSDDYANDRPGVLSDENGVNPVDSSIKTSLTSIDPWLGTSALAVKMRTTVSEYNGMELTGPSGQPLPVAADKTLAGSVAVRTQAGLDSMELFKLYLRAVPRRRWRFHSRRAAF